MRDWLDVLALALGYLVLGSVAVILVATVLGVLIPVKPKPRKRIVLDRYGPFLTPHPHRTPVYHLEAASDDEAWRAISARAS